MQFVRRGLLSCLFPFIITGPLLAGGLKKGDPIGVFKVTKMAGAESDGVRFGDELCYRCRYGSSPIVMVFARTNSPQVAALATKLEQALMAHQDEDLKGLITLLGENVLDLRSDAEELVSKTGVKRIPIVVAKDNVDGPSNYKLGPEEISIVFARNSQVVQTYTIPKASELNLAQLSSQIKKLLP